MAPRHLFGTATLGHRVEKVWSLEVTACYAGQFRTRDFWPSGKNRAFQCIFSSSVVALATLEKKKKERKEEEEIYI